MPKADGRAQGNANLLKANCVRFAGQSRLRTALQPFSFWEYIACLMQKHREAFLCPDEKLLRSAFGQSCFPFYHRGRSPLFPFPILLVIFMNECRSVRFRKCTQMIMYMPYFISTVVLVSIIIQFADISSGFINRFIAALGGKPVNSMGKVNDFRSIYV